MWIFGLWFVGFFFSAIWFLVEYLVSCEQSYKRRGQKWDPSDDWDGDKAFLCVGKGLVFPITWTFKLFKAIQLENLRALEKQKGKEEQK